MKNSRKSALAGDWAKRNCENAEPLRACVDDIIFQLPLIFMHKKY